MKGPAGNSRNVVRLPLFLTLVVHLGVLLLALTVPRLVPPNLRVPEVYQVELYRAPEAPPEPALIPLAPRSVTDAPAIIAPPPPPAKIQSKPAVAPSVPAPAAKSRTVSLSPIKERLARENREREEKARLDRQLKERLNRFEQDRREQKADALTREAERLAGQARQAIAESYRLAPTRPLPPPVDNISKPRNGEVTAQGTGTVPKEVSPEVLADYKARLTAHIAKHWSLPDLQNWDKSLTTVISIKMKSNGMVSPGGVSIATSSGNPRYDKEPRKAVIDSLPLPPLPPEFGKNGEEIVVTFTPRGLK